MGKIFSWEQIVNRKVPSMDSFEGMKIFIRNVLLHCEGIVGAAFCGSILKKEVNIRSDIDAVVVYLKDEREAVRKKLQIMVLIAYQHHIRIEFIPVDAESAKMGGHGIARSFYEHLTFSSKKSGIIKKDPRELIVPDTHIVDETLNYVSNKRAKTKKRLTKLLIEGPKKYYFLEKIIKAPVYVARKVLRCFDMQVFAESDSKLAVVRHYGSRVSDSEQWEILQAVDELNSWYSLELKEQIMDPNKERYEKVIQEIVEITPRVLDFLKINYVLVKELC